MPRPTPFGYIRQIIPLWDSVASDGAVLYEEHSNPTLADIDYFLDGGACQAAAQTLAHTTMPDGLARSITATRTDVNAGDTGLVLVIVGTDNDGVAITENLTLTTSTTTYETTKAFKTITSATQATWVIGGVGADTLEIGFGTLIGLKKAYAAVADVLVTLCPVTTVRTVVGGAGGTLALSTVDCSAATYDGTKDVFVFYRPSHSTVFTGTGALVVAVTAALGYECEVEEFGFTANAAMVGGSAATSFTLKDSSGNVIATLPLVACAAGASTSVKTTDIIASYRAIGDAGTLTLSRVTAGTAFTSGNGKFWVRVRQKAQRA